MARPFKLLKIEIRISLHVSQNNTSSMPDAECETVLPHRSFLTFVNSSWRSLEFGALRAFDL
jgi:hypothetical protein